jgi:acid stress chaperone HdeB
MKIMLIALATLTALLVSPAAQAQMTVDVTKISCQQFLIGKVVRKDYLGLWLSGYYNGTRNNTVIDISAMQKNADKVEDYCRLNLDITVMDAVKNALGPGK